MLKPAVIDFLSQTQKSREVNGYGNTAFISCPLPAFIPAPLLLFLNPNGVSILRDGNRRESF